MNQLDREILFAATGFVLHRSSNAMRLDSASSSVRTTSEKDNVRINFTGCCFAERPRAAAAIRNSSAIANGVGTKAIANETIAAADHEIETGSGLRSLAIASLSSSNVVVAKIDWEERNIRRRRAP